MLQLQGACKATIKGEECVVIRLAKSRAKPHQNGKVYLNLEAVSHKNGADDYGNTHFVVEPQTKDERESVSMRMPILGNGKEWSNEGQQTQSASTTRQIPRAQPQAQEPEDDTSDIPF